MIKLEKILPTGKSWRELWQAQNISGTNWPSSVRGGQPVTLTNAAAKRTTTDGVHFLAGVATSNIKFADPHDAVNDLWISLRFKLDQDFSSASSTDQYLAAKYVDATNFWVVYLRASDGKLIMSHREGNGAEDIVSAETSWTAGTWYHVLVSCNTGNGQRLIVDGGTAVTQAGNQTAISLIADVTIGARDDGTSTEGFAGVIADVAMSGGADETLTTTADTGEEALLAKGYAPSDAINLFTLDEGRGTTANDRGSGADDGTLDSSCYWDYDVKQAVMSLDGINDYGISSAGIDPSGSTSLVWVGKIKSTYSTLGAEHFLIGLLDAGVKGMILAYDTTANNIQWRVIADSDTVVNSARSWTIGEYLIIVGISDPTIASGQIFYINGVSQGTPVTTTELAASSTIRIGSSHTPDRYSVDKPILVGLIGGALSGQEALNLSRYINKWLGLGLTI